MKLAKFGDLAPGTIWKTPGEKAWWLKVDARYVYSVCLGAPEGHIGWGIQIVGPGVEDGLGLLHWTGNDREVIVWDGKEDLNVQGS